MALISRSRTRTSTEPDAAVAPSAAPAESSAGEARVHIAAGGRVVIDLTHGDTATTTDITCPNCGGTIRVEDVDRDMRSAEMHCLDCHFRFAQRLTLQADAQEQSAEGRPRGRFLRGKH